MVGVVNERNPTVQEKGVGNRETNMRVRTIKASKHR